MGLKFERLFEKDEGKERESWLDEFMVLRIAGTKLTLTHTKKDEEVSIISTLLVDIFKSYLFIYLFLRKMA